ncbi:hypothetical protein Tdes44962_MAKER09082 [Teratosphaeria destructans]|uniref:Uncharacterized protein n=1 Tax=Teratosphaeria destructans TaxID=418781 RepID=A0A9W7SUW9_9PEZI|nr:hypothetical protein Tdes44962_MAKER09082 [Teratosphaeria destructans]
MAGDGQMPQELEVNVSRMDIDGGVCFGNYDSMIGQKLDQVWGPRPFWRRGLSTGSTDASARPAKGHSCSSGGIKVKMTAGFTSKSRGTAGLMLDTSFFLHGR